MTHRAPLLMFAVAVTAVASCVHEVAPPEDGHSALFVAEGDELLDQLEERDGYSLSPAIPTRGTFSRVGLRYDATGPVLAEVRLSTDGAQSFGTWHPTTLTFHEETANNSLLDVDVSEATHLQVRFMAAVESGLSFLMVDAFVPAEEAEVQASVQTQGLAADGIALPRSAWGARARSCNTASAPQRITIHHTETPNNDSMTTPARLRQIQNYHIDVRGWCDIGYHFLVGRDGNVYQGRRENTLGAHVANANANNVGISFVGSFMSTAPTAAMEEAGARIIGAVARAYGISLNRDKVKGHRERGSSDCPGDRLYARLGALLTQAAGEDTPDPVDPPTECPRVRVVGAGTLNVRPDPNTSRSPRGTLSEDDVVDVLSVVNGQNIGGVSTWYEIESGALTGFISGAYAQCEGQDAPPPPAPSDLYGGLERGTARIPRSGLSNDTLENALGVASEPYGALTSYQGRDYVSGGVSHFGGPDDSGVSATETGAITGERLRELNDPMNPSASTLAARSDDFYYVAMRWDYTPHGRSFWENARILVVNPQNGRQVVLRPVDWGPNTSTGRIIDVSPQAIVDLGASTDDTLLVSFAADGASLGVH